MGGNMLRVLILALMLGCGTAYASEPASPAPATTTQDKPNQADSTPNLVSTNVGDFITDASIGLLVIISGLFVAIGFLDRRKKDKE